METFTFGLALGSFLGAAVCAILQTNAAGIAAARNRALQRELAETRSRLAHAQLRREHRDRQIARIVRNLPVDGDEERPL